MEQVLRDEYSNDFRVDIRGSARKYRNITPNPHMDSYYKAELRNESYDDYDEGDYDKYTIHVLYCDNVEIWRKQSTLSTSNGRSTGSSHTAHLSGDAKAVYVEESDGGLQEFRVAELYRTWSLKHSHLDVLHRPHPSRHTAGMLSETDPQPTLQVAEQCAKEKAEQISSTAFAETTLVLSNKAAVLHSLCIGTLLFRVSSFTVAPTRAQLIVSRIRYIYMCQLRRGILIVYHTILKMQPCWWQVRGLGGDVASAARLTGQCTWSCDLHYLGLIPATSSTQVLTSTPCKHRMQVAWLLLQQYWSCSSILSLGESQTALEEGVKNSSVRQFQLPCRVIIVPRLGATVAAVCVYVCVCVCVCVCACTSTDCNHPQTISVPGPSGEYGFAHHSWNIPTVNRTECSGQNGHRYTFWKCKQFCVRPLSNMLSF